MRWGVRGTRYEVRYPIQEGSEMGHPIGQGGDVGYLVGQPGEWYAIEKVTGAEPCQSSSFAVPPQAADTVEQTPVLIGRLFTQPSRLSNDIHRSPPPWGSLEVGWDGSRKKSFTNTPPKTKSFCTPRT